MGRRKTISLENPELSRSALDEFVQCPLCFYLHRRLRLKGLKRIPLTLAIATDQLLKNEFDAVRSTGAPHPLWQREQLNVRAFAHPDIDLWRNNFKGMRVVHAATQATISGAVDDVWQHCETAQLHIVDYKSTAKEGTPDLESGFGDGYKRQMEIYQWLFRHAGFDVSPRGYFLYVNGVKQGGFYDSLDGRMKFETTLIAYDGDTSWVDDCIERAVACFRGETVPASGADCDTCRYVGERAELAPGIFPS